MCSLLKPGMLLMIRLHCTPFNVSGLISYVLLLSLIEFLIAMLLIVITVKLFKCHLL